MYEPKVRVRTTILTHLCAILTIQIPITSCKVNIVYKKGNYVYITEYRLSNFVVLVKPY